MCSANLDASNPRPPKSLRTELEVQERARNRDKEDAGRAKQAFVNAVSCPFLAWWWSEELILGGLGDRR